MKRRSRRNHTPAFNANVALLAVKNDGRWRSWRSSSTGIHRLSQAEVSQDGP
jgi:hypothetical protein